MKRLFTFKMLRLVMALIAIVVMGCESADIETGTTTMTNDSSSSSGSNPNGTNPNTPYQTIAVAPASGVHNTIGNLTLLEITPVAGYTYRWTLSDPSLGNISPMQGSKVTYFTTSIPSAGTAEQLITVIGTKSGSTVRYKGTSTITHRAN